MFGWLDVEEGERSRPPALERREEKSQFAISENAMFCAPDMSLKALQTQNLVRTMYKTLVTEKRTIEVCALEREIGSISAQGAV